MTYPPPPWGGRCARASLLVCALLVVTAPLCRAQAPLPGLDTPQPIGAYLGGLLPSSTPGVGTGGWDVVEAFPNLTFLDPVYLTPEPGSTRLFVVGKPGIIYSFPNNPAATPGDVTTVLDIRNQVRLGGDSGMLNMAFHPEYGQPASPNRDYFYLWYRYTPDPSVTSGFATPAYIRLSRFTISQISGAAAAASELVLIQQFDRHDWHNGGGMFFGADGFLYVTVGDEGGANDEYDSSQKIDEALLGGVLRIDVDEDPARSHPIRRQPQNPANPPAGWPGSFTANYYVPDDNPWVDAGGNTLEEFYAIGLRSPHTMSRDPLTGWVFIGDVGQGSREEVSFLEPAANFQWPYREGSIGGPASQPGTLIGNDTAPVWDYDRSEGGCVIGGVVYRGSEHAALLGGKYLFGDHNSRNIWAMTYVPGQSPSIELLAQMPPTPRDKAQLASFGLDHAGEVYMCKPDGTDEPGGRIYKLSRTGASSPEPPALLSQTGAFSNLAALTPAPGIIPYGVKTPLWSDGALKQRWLAIPNNGTHDTPAEQVSFSKNGNWDFPNGTVFIKHFEIPLDERIPNGPRRRLETRFLVRGSDGQYYGATYKWRADNSEADLVAAAGTEEPVSIIDAAGQPLTLDWLYPGRGACMTCHTPQSGRVLGPRTRQFNGDFFYLATGRTSNQLFTLNHLGIFSPALDPASLPAYLASASIDDAGASLQKRALSYVDSNCMQCHQPGGAALALFDARLSTPPAFQGIIDGEAINNLGVPGAKIIKAQDLAGSVLYQRLNSLGGCCAMPPLAKNRTDETAIAVVAAWIQSLDPAAFPGGAGTAVNGVAFEYYEGAYAALPDFDSLTPLLTGTTAGFNLGPRLRDDNFAFRFRAKLLVEIAGAYTFFTSSDDGSQLSINGALIVDNDGLHANEEASGAVANLSAGIHDIEVTFFEALGGNLLTVSWAGPGIAKQFIPAQNLFLANLDLAEPLASVSTPSSNVTGLFPVAVDFTEAVTGLEITDFSTSNATAAGLTGTGASYTLTLMPIVDGEITVQLPSDRVIDSAANSNPPSNLLAVTYTAPGGDPPPSALLSTASGSVTGPFQVTALFSEPVTGLALSDFALSNATADALTGSGASYSLTVSPLAAGLVDISLPASSVVDATGNPNTASNLLAVAFTAPGGGQTPFGGVAATIPGRVEAENFDEGGEGLAYSDTEPENFGLTFEGLDYRPGGVDIEPSFDVPASPSVGWIEAGEWMEYTLSVSPGTYDMTLRVASGLTDPGDLRVLLDGVPIGTAAVTGTGGWLTWANLTLPATVTFTDAGTHVLRIESLGTGTNFNWIEFTPAAGGDPPPSALLSTASGSVTGPFQVTALFSEPVTGLALSDFALSNATADALTGSGASYSLTVSPLAAGPVDISLPASSVVDATGNPNTASNLLAVTYVDPGAGQTPFGGVAATIPGRVEAENFDEGGEGLAYSDTEPENLGVIFEGFDYRPGGVDIEPSFDVPASPSVGWIEAGEWMEYTLSVSPGTYDMTLRVASGLTDPGDLRVLLDGVPIGTAAVTGTGGWFNWVTLTIPSVNLAQGGTRILRVEALGAGANLNWIEFTPAGADPPPSVTLSTAATTVFGPFTVNALFSEPVTGLAASDFTVSGGSVTALSGAGAAYALTVTPAAPGPLSITLPPASAIDVAGNPNTASNLLAVTYVDPAAGQTPFGGVAVTIPGRVESENFDEGGEGVAYTDTEAENLGVTYEGFDYRPGGVDIEPSFDTGGTPSVGWIEPGEWMEYTLSASPGTYEVTLRIASGLADSGDLRVLLDGVPIGTAAVTGTGGWLTWATLTLPATVTFTDTGLHILRIESLGTGTNFNWIEFADASPTTQELFDDFLIAAGITGSQGAAMGDPDNDGASNLREFAFGTDPTNGAQPDPLVTFTATGGDREHLAVSFPALAGGTTAPDGSYTASGVTYRPVASADLANWNLPLSPTGNPSGLPSPPAGYLYLTYIVPINQPAAYLCVEIEADL